jgi:RNA polymerase sigma-70 factor (ECF subfamily)
VRSDHLLTENQSSLNPLAHNFVILFEKGFSIWRGEHVPNSNDADLVKRAQGGDVNAVGELYDRHHESIFRYVQSRVYDRDLAEDLTGEIFTRMVTSLPGYRLRGIPFRAWLYRIARNLVVDHYRKESGRVSVPLYHAESTGEAASNPAWIVEHKLTLERVQRALARLDPSQQEVVVLRFLLGLSLREVALTLNKTVAAVKSLQHRGLKALRVWR